MTLPNKLSLIRLSVAPVYFLLFWLDLTLNKPEATLTINIILIILITLAEISDAMDGRLARSRGEVTDFGKLFDPFADHVSRFTIFFCFWWLQLVPAWMVVLIFYREVSVSFLRLLVRGENVVLAARRSGKIKAIVQAIAIYGILIARILHFWIQELPVPIVASSIMAIVVIVTLISMFDYIFSCKDIIKQIEK
ncbi:CDP-diacylglycerol--glycerol-3-phosphate 3-phosphatidyltransferase [bacterium]|nr:CDP-diacylglycerol--glycerol-3-phosphate 3-phosphatidyltransferase [candidate division CSSED10-310 bacterium]